MTLKTHLFGFMSEPVTDVGSNHKVAAWSLRIQCWLTFIGAAFMALFFLFLSLFSMVAGAAFDTFMQNFEWWPFGDGSGAAVGVLFGLMMVFVGIFVVVLMGLFLWWNNHTYRVWNNNEDGAIVWANIFGAVLVLFGFGNFFSYSSTASGTSFGMGGNFFGLILGALILIFGNMAHSKGELDGTAGTSSGGSGGVDPA